MAYVTTPAPYLRKKKTTLQIMIELGIAIGLVWVAAVITTFMKLGTSYGIKSILLMVVALLTTGVCDALTTLLRNKKEKGIGKKIVFDLVHNYSWITAMIFTLLCPVWTSYYVVIVGSIFATVVVKNFFGGFGSNIFNPAAFGRIFIQLGFDLSAPSSITSGLDTTTGSTLTGAFNSTQQWLGSNALTGYSIKDILLGNYFGTMGEPFTILLLVIGVVLAIRGVINWRAPVFYVGTVAVSSLLIALVCGFNNPILYMVYHLGLGGLMFGAVFMITDPVTTPTSGLGNCIAGTIAALLTLLIRTCTQGCEGVVYSIAIVNLLSPAIDALIVKKTNEKVLIKSLVTFGSVLLTVGICAGAAFGSNGGREVYSINGYSIEQYNRLKEVINLNCIEENNYTIAKYSKTLTEDLTSLYTVEIKDADGNVIESFDSAYSLLDKSKNEVGVVYCVSKKIEIIKIEDEEENRSKQTGVAYVAISTKDSSIMGVSLYKAPATATSFGDQVTNAINDYDFTTGNFLEETALAAGATYTSKGAIALAQCAFDIYQAQYGN